jgi:hypothetical protein
VAHVRVGRLEAGRLREAQPRAAVHAQLALEDGLRVRQVHVARARAPPTHEELPRQPHVARASLEPRQGEP